MVFKSQGQSGTVLTITTTKAAKFSVGPNSDGTGLNILFVDQSELQSRVPIVVLDAGHGGSDPGASGAYLQEKDVNLAVVLKAGQLLTAKGIKVVYTRTDDTYVGLDDRSTLANFYNASVFVSVHCNANTSSAPNGTETYCYYPLEDPELYLQKDERYNLALDLQQALVADLGRADRGVKQGNLSVLRETTMPSALAEIAFISNPTEEALMQQQQFTDLAGKAIADAIVGYMNENVTVNLNNVRP
jgi:N-acetylmuramoyl-L-alanine amidase